MNTLPALTESRPATQCIRVDLPEPDGPMIAVKRPAWKLTDTPSRARTSVSPLPYTFTTFTARAAAAGPRTGSRARFGFHGLAHEPQTLRGSRWSTSRAEPGGAGHRPGVDFGLVTCPSCQADVLPGARFCADCGQDLRLRGDERRIVTVLFADLVGFTSLSETRDPEQVKNLVDGCFEHLVQDIDAFGGRVDKIIGDAIVALFGAPVAHEDDAERAVRAALRMQATLAGVTADLDVRSGCGSA